MALDTHQQQRSSIWGPPMVIAAMAMLQLGAALSLPVADRIGSAATVWIRLLFAAVFMVLLIRAPWRQLSRATMGPVLALGFATAGLTGFYLAAAQRIDLGLASAIEFLGPLGVAVATGAGRARFLWPALAAAGVVGMTEPWRGTPDPVGMLFAAASAACWAAYILLTKRSSALLPGSQTLAFSLPVAALVMTVPGVGMPGLGHIRWEDLVLLGVLAGLNPVIPFLLELAALRAVAAAAFGIMMSLEPAMALLIGTLVLGQVPSLVQVLGIALVVAATVATQLSTRIPTVEEPSVPGPAKTLA